MALSFKLAGLTPTEWANEEAARWNEAMTLRNAYDEGVQSVKNKVEADQAAMKMMNG